LLVASARFAQPASTAQKIYAAAARKLFSSGLLELLSLFLFSVYVFYAPRKRGFFQVCINLEIAKLAQPGRVPLKVVVL
jgi:hypothetical protein